MRSRTKTLFENNAFILTQHSKTKKSEKYFTVRAKHYSVDDQGHFNSDYLERMRDHFDPAKCRGSKNTNSWKFKTRNQAEHLILTALLKKE